MRRKLVLLAMRYPGLKLLLLRRTLPELRANHILPLQRELAGYAAWSGAERAFRFPNGSRLVMGYCDSDSDCAQYQGQEYEVIGFEEATNFEPDWLTFIATCLRTTRTDFVPRIYYTCNPGGPGPCLHQTPVHRPRVSRRRGPGGLRVHPGEGLR